MKKYQKPILRKEEKKNTITYPIIRTFPLIKTPFIIIY